MTSTMCMVTRSDKYVRILVIDNVVESLNHGRLLLAFTGKVLNNMAPHKGLKIQVKKLFVFVDLYAPLVAYFRGGYQLLECRRDCFGLIGVDRNCIGKHEKYINHGR